MNICVALHLHPCIKWAKRHIPIQRRRFPFRVLPLPKWYLNFRQSQVINPRSNRTWYLRRLRHSRRESRGSSRIMTLICRRSQDRHFLIRNVRVGKRISGFSRIVWSSDYFLYCSSVTFSIQSTNLPFRHSWMAICVIAVVGVAPCQCFSPGANQTTSPGWISSIGPSSRCTQPNPAVTINVCPNGCVCQAVRAPGSNVTAAPAARAESFA